MHEGGVDPYWTLISPSARSFFGSKSGGRGDALLHYVSIAGARPLALGDEPGTEAVGGKPLARLRPETALRRPLLHDASDQIGMQFALADRAARADGAKHEAIRWGRTEPATKPSHWAGGGVL